MFQMQNVQFTVNGTNITHCKHFICCLIGFRVNRGLEYNKAFSPRLKFSVFQKIKFNVSKKKKTAHLGYHLSHQLYALKSTD